MKALLEARRMRGHMCFAVAVLIAMTLTVAGCVGWGHQVPTALHQPIWLKPALSAEPFGIQASGTIEARDVAIVAELGGRVMEVTVDEGDMVRHGQPLVVLDDTDLVVQIAQAQAALRVAQAELDRTRAGARPEEVAAAQTALHQALIRARGAWREWQDAIRAREHSQDLEMRITEARTDLALTEHDVEMAEAELEAARQSRDREKWGSVEYRIAEKQVAAAEESLAAAQALRDGARAKLAALQAMHERPLILEAEMHAAEGAYRIACADVAVARAELEAIKAPPLAEDIAVAQAGVHRAQAALRVLEVMRKKMTLHAPCDGLVSSRAVEVGEIATPGAPLLTIADLGEVTLVIYVPETQIGRVRLGQEAVVTVDSYPGRGFDGRVTYIADQAEFTPRNVQTKEERVNTVFAVEITLSNPEWLLKPGMPADALLRE